MAIEDKIKWDKKYQGTPRLLRDRQPSAKLKKFFECAKSGKALEIACGTGRNAIFLANQGFDVEALDISSVALEFLDAKKLSKIITKQVDLVGYIPARDSYELIVKTNYLDREIIPYLFDALKQDGILILETYMEHHSNTKVSSNPAYLLQSGELKSFFENLNCEIIEYDEFDNDASEEYRMRKQSIIIKKG